MNKLFCIGSALGLALGGFAAPSAAYDCSCDNALIMSTYTNLGSYSSDWRLAKFVDYETYNALKQSVGAGGSFLGISLGGNYDTFKANYNKMVASSNESLSVDEAHQIFWSGLDPKSSANYQACLQANLFNSPGLHAGVIAADKNSVYIKVKWSIPNSSLPIRVQWVPPETAAGIDTNIPSGEKVVVFQRPKVMQYVYANGLGIASGYTTERIALAPLPKPVLHFGAPTKAK